MAAIPRPEPVSSISPRSLPMVRSDQTGSLQRSEQIASLLRQHLEPPSLVGFDLRDLDDDGGQLGNLRMTRCRQSLESGRILRRDMRLAQVVEDLFFLLYRVPVLLRQPSAVFAHMRSVAFAGELFVRSCSSAASAVVPHVVFLCPGTRYRYPQPPRRSHRCRVWPKTRLRLTRDDSLIIYINQPLLQPENPAKHRFTRQGLLVRTRPPDVPATM